VKDLIEEKEKIPKAEQIIVYCGKQLEDNICISTQIA
jgi:hypothetical protein